MLITVSTRTIHLDLIRHRSVYYRDTRKGQAIMPEKVMTRDDFEKFLKPKKEKVVKLDKKERAKELLKKISLSDLTYNQESIVQSIEEYFEEKGYITPKQEELLINILERLD